MYLLIDKGFHHADLDYRIVAVFRTKRQANKGRKILESGDRDSSSPAEYDVLPMRPVGWVDRRQVGRYSQKEEFKAWKAFNTYVKTLTQGTTK